MFRCAHADVKISFDEHEHQSGKISRLPVTSSQDASQRAMLKHEGMLAYPLTSLGTLGILLPLSTPPFHLSGSSYSPELGALIAQ